MITSKQLFPWVELQDYAALDLQLELFLGDHEKKTREKFDQDEVMQFYSLVNHYYYDQRQKEFLAIVARLAKKGYQEQSNNLKKLFVAIDEFYDPKLSCTPKENDPDKLTFYGKILQLIPSPVSKLLYPLFYKYYGTFYSVIELPDKKLPILLGIAPTAEEILELIAKYQTDVAEVTLQMVYENLKSGKPIRPSFCCSESRLITRTDDLLAILSSGEITLRYKLSIFDRTWIRADGKPVTDEDVDKVEDFIDSALAKNLVPYVHCKSGKARSATIVIAYLVDRFPDTYTLATAVAYVKKCRSKVALKSAQAQFLATRFTKALLIDSGRAAGFVVKSTVEIMQNIIFIAFNGTKESYNNIITLVATRLEKDKLCEICQLLESSEISKIDSQIYCKIAKDLISKFNELKSEEKLDYLARETESEKWVFYKC